MALKAQPLQSPVRKTRSRPDIIVGQHFKQSSLFAIVIGLALAAVAVQARSSRAHLLHGQALLTSGDLAAAERELRTVLKVLPDSPDVHTWVGLLHQEKGELRAARTSSPSFTCTKALWP